jgi:hypothetical protein
LPVGALIAIERRQLKPASGSTLAVHYPGKVNILGRNLQRPLRHRIDAISRPVEKSYRQIPRPTATRYYLLKIIVLKFRFEYCFVMYQMPLFESYRHVFRQLTRETLMSIRVPLSAVLLSALVFSAESYATPILFTGSGTAATNSAAASASFDIVGNQLTITLQNIAPSIAGQDSPGSTLSGLFFDLPGNPLLTTVSATVALNSIIQSANCTIGGPSGNNAAACAAATNVGGEWGYSLNEAGAPATLGNEGIASSGYLSMSSGNFGGPDLDDPGSLNGINFGIVSAAAGFDPNGGLAAVPLIRDSVVFVLTGVSGLSNSDISNVSFQYGTAFTEANVPGSTGSTGGGGGSSGNGIPEPNSSALALLGVALLAVTFLKRQKSHRV